ncbi:MAG: hypothetical protein D6707_10385, partial [Bacteroidetes bacterium]
MKQRTLIMFIALLTFLTASNGFAQKVSQITTHQRDVNNNFNQSVNFCPGGLAFGIVVLNYEYLVDGHHGLVLRGDYEHVPNSYSEAKIESFGYSFTLNYRYHFSGAMNSYFTGVYARYRIFEGEGKVDETPFEFTRSDISYGVNAGKRWVWNNGFNIT